MQLVVPRGRKRRMTVLEQHEKPDGIIRCCCISQDKGMQMIMLLRRSRRHHRGAQPFPSLSSWRFAEQECNDKCLCGRSSAGSNWSCGPCASLCVEGNSGFLPGGGRRRNFRTLYQRGQKVRWFIKKLSVFFLIHSNLFHSLFKMNVLPKIRK